MAGYIDLYHIDSEESLQVFVSTLRAHNVDDIARPAWWGLHALSRDYLASVVAWVRSQIEPWDGDTAPMSLSLNED